MNLVAMTIPDDPADLPVWLERHLVGLELAALVAELSAVHAPANGPPLDELLGQRRQTVLEQGLRFCRPPS